jgi:4-amino-4-deoxy-L-arabinose transferase-like glycosyltransferase
VSVTVPPPGELAPRERALRRPAPEVDLPELPPEVRSPPAPPPVPAWEPGGWPGPAVEPDTSVAPPGWRGGLQADEPGRMGLSSSPSRALRLAPWLLLALFLAVELAICFAQLTGPFLDEGIYVTAGLRTLQGHGVADNYLGWFAGSLLWPVIAALGWKVAGLAGARAAAALCVSAGLAGMVAATGNLLGPRTRAYAALAAVTSGPVLALGHLAVYDTAAVAFTGGAFWAVSEFLRRDDRAWLVGAALLYALAGLSKYPVLAFTAPPLVLLVLAARGRRAVLDLPLFALVAGAVLLVYFMANRAQLIGFVSFRTHENPNFGVTTAQLAYSQVYYTLVPLLLALVGAVLLARRRALVLAPPERDSAAPTSPTGSPAVPSPPQEHRPAPTLVTGRPAVPAPPAGGCFALLSPWGRWLAPALLTGVLAAPVYHLTTGNPSGDQKHVVFGLLFILPLAGVTLERAFAGRRRWLVATLLTLGLGVFACAQVVRIDEGWPDLRASAAVLDADVHPGERLLVNSAWVEALYLYSHGRVHSPYDLYDVYRVEHLGRPVDVCDFQWFVVVPGGEAWPAAVRAQMLRCGSFREVYAARATLTNLGRDLRFVTYTEPIEIWRNERTQAAHRPRSSVVVGRSERNGL